MNNQIKIPGSLVVMLWIIALSLTTIAWHFSNTPQAMLLCIGWAAYVLTSFTEIKNED